MSTEVLVDKLEKRKKTMQERTYLDWLLAYSEKFDSELSEFVHAKVPGAVQLDIAHAENYPDYNYGDNYKMFRWMEDLFYTYRTEFGKPELTEDYRLWFVSKGIDYKFEIWLNNKKIFEQEGMFSYVEVDLTDYLEQKNILAIKIFPVPKRTGYPEDRTQASNVVKPAVSYGWDWHPRLIPLGIWDETFLEQRQSNYITDLHVNYTLSDDFSFANILLSVEGFIKPESTFLWELKDIYGNTVSSLRGRISNSFETNCVFQNPHLWWSHDYGIPYLYTSIFHLFDSQNQQIQIIKKQIGFRKVQMVMNDGAWDEPKEFPKSRSVAPAQILLNGKKIFAKGTNWVNPEIFPGIITHERYEELLKIVVETNFNIVRTWGGSIVNKESFFDLCDVMGILVWQEFSLACNNYPDEPNYLSVLENEATAIIKRLRKHPSVILWCGGNELFNKWSGMNDQSLALRLLNSLCLKYDPNTPYIPTSPLFGMGHGNYVFKWQGEDVFQMMNRSKNTAYSEFGLSGISPKSVLESIIPEKELFPPKNGTAWEEHHAYKAWDANPNTWLCQNILTEYMGEAKSLDELIYQSQLIQSEGYKAIYEEARRKKPYTSMALNWCFNEPWPAAANNSLVVYPAIPKPALYAVQKSCRPVCISARISKFDWKEDEYFFAEIWILNDTFSEIESKRILVKLHGEGDEILIMEWQSVIVESNRNLHGPTIRFQLPKWNVGQFKLKLEVQDYPELNSEYTLMYKKKPKNNLKTFGMNT